MSANSASKILASPILGRALANLTISGEAPLSPTTFDSACPGEPRSRRTDCLERPASVPVTDGSLALATAAPHPHAAMLFIDFALSKGGQLIYQDLGYACPSRSGVGHGSISGPERIYLANRPII